ncbi:hypothetical protein PR048_011143 [Dryococelus australis]|uniref:Uncharacterized protein n=1 Tax=Dryococelus australis TaxID=614101 RepID=A0ABQ9HL23_9NEOP|nr:hypothetical protein PR048_011143 [Dryococelus australis]
MERNMLKTELELHQRKVELAGSEMKTDDLMKTLPTLVSAPFMDHDCNSPQYSVKVVDRKFLESRHSLLQCDQDFGLIEKSKKYYKAVFAPPKTSFVTLSWKLRKQDEEKEKVKWLKMQWILLASEKLYIDHYKYTNSPRID